MHHRTTRRHLHQDTRRTIGRTIAASAAALLAAALAMVPATASAHRTPAAPTVTVLSAAVDAPFNLAVRRGTVFVADGGNAEAGVPAKVFRLDRSGLSTVAAGPAGGDVAGIDVARGELAYTSSEFGPDGPTNGSLTVLGRHGRTRVTSLADFEARRNPDQRIAYGVDRPSDCVRAALEKLEIPVSYTGQVDSHPYAVTAGRHGSWIVADAGGNDLVRIDDRGRAHRLAVLPRQPLTLTAPIAATLGLPDCAIGVTYNFEAVPTDVEVGPDGWLYVSTLPGGPEDPSLGARGAVYKVNPWTGRTVMVAGGFAGATNLAVAADGTVYVAELFGGRISVVRHGRVSTYVTLPGALSVEISGSTLYAGTFGAFTGGKGSIVEITR